MKNITGFLDEIERLAYKILLWGLLVPKTLLKIIFEPEWVLEYVKEQIGDNPKQPFDRFISPVILFLLVTLIPAILIAMVPPAGITIIRPAPQTEDNPRDIGFTVQGSFRSSTARLFHSVQWELYEVWRKDENGNPAYITYDYNPQDYTIGYFDEKNNLVQDPVFIFRRGRLQDEITGVHELSEKNHEIVTSPKSLSPSLLLFLDGHTIEDHFSIQFEPGEYQVRVKVENYDLNEKQPVESFTDTIYITVPADPAEKIYFASASMVDGDTAAAKTVSTGPVSSRFRNQLEQGSTYALALGCLALPLLFSFGTKVLGEEGISETSMKESFYLQCYYFSPLTAAFWSWRYVITFTTSDIFLSSMDGLIAGVILILLLIWFGKAEVYAIRRERKVSKWRARGIFSLLIIILLIGWGLILFLYDPDFFRKFSIPLYPAVGAILLLGYIFRRLREKRKPGEKGEEPVLMNNSL